MEHCSKSHPLFVTQDYGMHLYSNQWGHPETPVSGFGTSAAERIKLWAK
jgi:hypothetical protein